MVHEREPGLCPRVPARGLVLLNRVLDVPAASLVRQLLQDPLQFRLHLATGERRIDAPHPVPDHRRRSRRGVVPRLEGTDVAPAVEGGLEAAKDPDQRVAVAGQSPHYGEIVVAADQLLIGAAGYGLDPEL